MKLEDLGAKCYEECLTSASADDSCTVVVRVGVDSVYGYSTGGFTASSFGVNNVTALSKAHRCMGKNQH